MPDKYMPAQYVSHKSLRVLSTAQLRAFESAWIGYCHHQWGLVLMELAAKGAARVVSNIWKDHPGPVTIVCGRGNNGGDGLVVARYLIRCNVPVNVFMIESSTLASDDNTVNRKILEGLGIEIKPLTADTIDSLVQVLSASTVVVDALLGTGLDRQVEGVYKLAIDAINASGCDSGSHKAGGGCVVVSIDLPSGVHSDTGQMMGTAVHARATVTFGYLKAGLLCYPGAELCGNLSLIDIGLPSPDKLPAELASLKDVFSKPHWWLACSDKVADILPERPADAHKGSCGRLLCIAGSSGMTGAAVMAATTALKAGTGLSVLATAKSLIRALPPIELIYCPLAETTSGTISVEAAKDLEKELKIASAVLIGPGLSANADTVKFVQELVADLDKPCIVDADGLNAIAMIAGAADVAIHTASANETDHFVLAHPERFVFTPHPKELSRLMGISVNDIQADRIAAAQKATQMFGCTIVLKGAHTVVATPGQDVYIIPTGNPGMATAGAGDVLAGVIGALLAQGVKPDKAAIAGAYIHAAAGDLAAENIGMDGVVAGDIMEFVPEVFHRLRSHSFAGSNLELIAE